MQLIWVLLLCLVPFAVVVAIEMAVFSVRAERLEGRRNDGDKRATIILDYLANPPRFLGCIQVYGTALSLIIGSLTAPALNPITTLWVEAIGIQGNTANWLPSAISLTLVTLFTLVFGNMIPKQIGFAHAEQVVLVTARLSALMLTLVRPLAIALEWITKILLKPFRISVISASPVTESDISILLKQGQNFGDIDAPETRIIERTFQLSDIPIVSVQIPRDKIEWFSLLEPMPALRDKLWAAEHSFAPICLTRLEDCIGVLKLRELNHLPDNFSKDDLEDRLLPVLVVPHDAKLLDVVEGLRTKQARIALIKDPGGLVQGLVSLNDMVAAVFGPMQALDC